MRRARAAAIKRLACALIASITLSARAGAQHLPALPVGYDAFRQWARWPMQRIGQRAYMQSTYDRAGGNEAADASHFLYQLAPDRNVTLDLQGPGILAFVRTNRWHGSPWHAEIDGTDTIVTDSATADPLHPPATAHLLPEAAFPPPLALTWPETKGADLSWVPIGFTRSLRLAYGRTFYGTGYYIYDRFTQGAALSTPITPWSAARRPPADVRHLIASAGTDIAPPSGAPGITTFSGTRDLPPHATTLIWSAPPGPATLRTLNFSIPRNQASNFVNTRLRITWDDRAAPSIDAPIALFYGAGTLFNRTNRAYLVKSFPMVIRFDATRIHLDCYFPMPFFHAARIELTNTTGSAIQGVSWTIRAQRSYIAAESAAYFHATYRDQDRTLRDGNGADLVLLDTRTAEGGGLWSGSFVGTSLIFSHDAELTPLEGDPRFFFDDSATPQAQGTGTEEWAGGGDYWGGQTTTLAFAGHPVGAPNAHDAINEADKIESAYRFLLSDLMPFGRRALIQLEHGGENRATSHYETIAYWYGLPAPSLIETDRLAIGDLASERAHAYHAPGASPPYSLTSRYEWGPDSIAGIQIYPPSTDRGRITSTGSDFTLKIDPHNLGVLLRRKLDYAVPNQRAAIAVADTGEHPVWHDSGIWYLAGSNTTLFSAPASELGAAQHIVQTSNRRFRDDEFLLPRALTTGKSTIRLRITPMPFPIPLYPGAAPPKPAWSEMRYTAYSYVAPARP